MKKITVLFIIVLCFSANEVLACPDIEGEYICGPLKVPLKLIRTQQGDFYRYQFSYSNQQPVSVLTDGVSLPSDVGDGSFDTTHCTEDVLEWSNTFIPLNKENAPLPLEQLDIKTKTAIAMGINAHQRPHVGLTEKFHESSNGWKNPNWINIDSHYPHLSLFRRTWFYSRGEDGQLKRKQVTIMPQPELIKDDLFDSAKVMVYDLFSGWVGSSFDEVVEQSVSKRPEIVFHTREIVDEDSCFPVKK